MACLWGILRNNRQCQFCVVMFCRDRKKVSDSEASTEIPKQDDRQDP